MINRTNSTGKIIIIVRNLLIIKSYEIVLFVGPFDLKLDLSS